MDEQTIKHRLLHQGPVADNAAAAAAIDTIERLQRELAPCSRSHPHENMGRMCELRVRVAKAENERFHAIERAEKAERERDEALGAVGWIKEWMVAEKYRKPDVTALVERAQRHYQETLKRAEKAERELEAASKHMLEMTVRIHTLADERNEARRERDEARAAIREAPHAVTCCVSEDTRGGYDTDESRCNCWKRAALGGEG